MSLPLLANTATADPIVISAPTLTPVVCGSGGAYLVPTFAAASTANGFAISAAVTLCNGTAIKTAIHMAVAGAGTGLNPVGGGPIFASPVAVSDTNKATVSADLPVISNLGQVVVVNVTGVGVTLLGEYPVACQAVYSLANSSPALVYKGC